VGKNESPTYQVDVGDKPEEYFSDYRFSMKKITDRILKKSGTFTLTISIN
jgi:hypothetical protein